MRIDPRFIFPFLLLLACGDDSSAPAMDAGTTGDAGPEPSVRAVFAPVADPMPWGVAPFPDDLYLDDEGHVALADFPGEADNPFFDYSAALRETLGRLDGFGALSPVFVPLDGAIDPASLPGDVSASLGDEASVFLVDADPASETAFERVPVEARWVPRHDAIAIRPADGWPLAEGRRYAAVVTTRVLAADGTPIGAAPGFAAVRDAMSAPGDPLLAEAHERYAPVLSSLGVPPGEVAALAVFRVQTVTDVMALVREQLWEADAPPVVIDEVLSGEDLDTRLGEPEEGRVGLDVEGGVKHDQIGYLVNGHFDAPFYIADRPNAHGPFDVEDGEVVVKRTEEVPFTLLLPAAAEVVRVVIFQHGITANRSNALGLANTLCDAGYAVIAIDAPFHGLRARGGIDEVNRFTGAEEPDGFGDRGGAEIIVEFAGIMDDSGPFIGFHPIYLRDAIRQSAADLLTLVRVVRSADWGALRETEGLGGLAFSEEPLGFIGYSLGGIIGTLFLAHEPQVGAAVLAVTGGSVLELVTRSPSLNPSYLPQLFPLLGLELAELDYEALPPSYYPELGLWQTLLDRGDSANYARRLRRGDANLLLQMARDDETVHNLATETLARALRAPILGGTSGYVELSTGTPPLRANVDRETATLTRGLYVFENATHGLALWRMGAQTVPHPVTPPFEAMDPVPIANPIEDAQAQLLGFFETWRAGAAEIAAPPE